MSAKRKNNKKVEEYSILAIEVSRFNAAIDSAINYEVKKPNDCDIDAKVYSFDSRLEISGTCSYPEDRLGAEYSITVYGTERKDGQFDLRLKDCHVRGEDWRPKYKKVRVKEVPVYDVPKGVGMVERIRGTKNWHGWLWVPPRVVSDMLALLPHLRPLYLEIYERKVGRHRWISNFSLQSNDPAEE